MPLNLTSFSPSYSVFIQLMECYTSHLKDFLLYEPPSVSTRVWHFNIHVTNTSCILLNLPSFLARVDSQLHNVTSLRIRITILFTFGFQQPAWCMASYMCSGNTWSIHLFIQQIFVKCFLVPTIILGAGDATVHKTHKNLCSCEAFILWEESDNKQDKPGKLIICLMIIKCHGKKRIREEYMECWDRTASLRMWHLSEDLKKEGSKPLGWLRESRREYALPVGDRCGWDGVSKSESVRKPDLQAEETQGARSTASKTIAKTVVFTSTKIQTFSYKISKSWGWKVQHRAYS